MGPLPTPFGSYDLLEELGSGAAGKVYRARHRLLEREVALKVLVARAGGDGGRDRLLREARAAAKLEHPNIARMYEVTEIEGAPCFAFELVRGETLRARLDRERALAPADALALIEKLARAAHFAHEQGIVHRDLKPENVLLDIAGEPHIVDFGIAKDLNDPRANLSQTGSLVGTPAYLAPEQAEGRVHDLDRRVDVWALGVILYELVTGARPFDAANVFDLLGKITETEPAPPRRPDGSGTRRAGEIALWALKKPRDDRPPTALALAEACRSALATGSGRRREVGLAAALVLVPLVAGGVFFAQKTTETVPVAPTPSPSSSAAPLGTPAPDASLAPSTPPAPTFAGARVVATFGDLRGRLGARVGALSLSPDATQLVAGTDDGDAFLIDAVSGDVLERRAHAGAVSAIAHSPDGKLVAIGRTDGSVELVAASTLETVPLAPVSAPRSRVTALAFALDGMLAAAFEGTAPVVWEVAARPPRVLPPEAVGTHAVLFLGNGKRLLGGMKDGGILLWSIPGFTSERFLKVDVGEIQTFEREPEGEAKSSEAKGGRGWVGGTRGVAELRLIGKYVSWSKADGRGPVAALASPDRLGGGTNFLVDCRSDGTVYLRSTHAGEIRGTLNVGTNATGAAVSHDGKWLWVASSDSVSCWDLATNQRVWPLGAEGFRVVGLGETSSGAILVARAGGELERDDLAARKNVGGKSTGGAIGAAAFSRDGRSALVSVPNGPQGTALDAWDLTTWTATVRAGTRFPWVRSLSITSEGDGAFLSEGSLGSWLVAANSTALSRPTAVNEAELEDKSGTITALACARDRPVIAFASSRAIWVRAEAGGTPGAVPPGPDHALASLALSPDGQLLLAAGTGGELDLFDRAAGSWRSLPVPARPVATAGFEGTRAAFLQGGKLLVVVWTGDSHVRVHSVVTGRELGVVPVGFDQATRLFATLDGGFVIGTKRGAVLKVALLRP